MKNGVTKLWVQGYMPLAEPGPIVVPVKIRRSVDGRYGWKAVASVPVLNEGHGFVMQLDLTLQKRILSASCPGNFLFAAVRSTFEDGGVVESHIVRRCRGEG